MLIIIGNYKYLDSYGGSSPTCTTTWRYTSSKPLRPH